MTFARACALSEVPVEEALRVTLGRYDLAIAQNIDDAGTAEVFALEDQCSHAAVALSDGEVLDCQIECFLHGSMFDLRTGKPTNLPATEPVATFPIEIREEQDGPAVWVDVDTTLNGVTPT